MKRLTQEEGFDFTSHIDDLKSSIDSYIARDNYIKNINVVHDYLCENDFNFTDNLMLLIREKKEDYILQEMSKASLKIGVYVDEARLKEWLKMCESLQNISSECAEDIAIKSKIKRLEQRIYALEDEIKSLISENKALKKELENE